MRRTTWGIALLLAFFAATLVMAQNAPPKPPVTGQAMSGVADMKNAKGEAVGTIQLTETRGGVLLQAVLTGLPPGGHAFHIHEAGKCDAPDFKTAGAHFNPAQQHHGFQSPQGAHAGDLPNIFVAADGKLQFEVFARGVTLGPGPHSLLNPGGTSLVVHQAIDDYKTDPAGNAGARIACGVIRGK